VRGVSSVLALQILQTGKLPQNYNWTYNAMEDLRFIQGILQHHDAITGTCMKQVVADYLDMVAKGSSQGKYVLKENFKGTAFRGIELDHDLRIWNGSDLRSLNSNEELCVVICQDINLTERA
jgi:hypothetical protein